MISSQTLAALLIGLTLSGAAKLRVSPQALADELSANEEVLVNPVASKVIAKANSEAASEIVPSDVLCPRAWSSPCPDGWKSLGATCQAPDSYGGPCASAQSFKDAAAVDKYKFSIECAAPWPCASDACATGKDYDVCPEGWSTAGNGFCQGSTATSKCASLYNFDDLAIAEKQELAAACGLSWPCRSACEQDYSVACPKGWSAVGGLCLAPASYAGDCGFSMNMTGMSQAQKSETGAKCGTEFPCAKR